MEVTRGQAYTEYVIILTVMFALGMGVASVFIWLDDIAPPGGYFFQYYASLANYLNLPFI